MRNKKTAQAVPCRFCGQMIQLEPDTVLTEQQAEEEAVMLCRCPDAKEYQKQKKRREKALRNVGVLFGEMAAEEKRIRPETLNILCAAVEEVYAGELAKITLNLRGGVRACVSQNGKGEINVERTETKKEKLTE